MTNLSPIADQLLDVAHRLILQGGYKSFSYADLAAVVGIRKASIHHHFPTKADLVLTLVRRYQAQTFGGSADALRQLPTLAAKLDAYAAHWAACIEDGSQPICLAVLLASEMPSLPPEVAQEVRSHFLQLSRLIEAEFEAAGVAAPGLRAETFLAVMHGAMIAARAAERPELFGIVVRHWLHDASVTLPATDRPVVDQSVVDQSVGRTLEAAENPS